MTDKIVVTFESPDGTTTKEIYLELSSYAASAASGHLNDCIAEATPMVESEIGSGACVKSIQVNGAAQPR